MSSPARRRSARLARRRRLFQDQAGERKAARERAYQSWREERQRMGFGVDIVTDTPTGLKDVSPPPRAMLPSPPSSWRART